MDSKSSKRDKPFAGKIDLSRLFGATVEELEAAASTEMKNLLPLGQIYLKPEQVRRYFDPPKMEQLTASIREYGILENLITRPLPGRSGEYELVAGERRYRAAQTIGLTEVPVTILELTDQQALQISLIENLQREDLNPVEETEEILQLLAIRLDIPVEEVVSLLYKMQNELTRNVNHNVVVHEEEDKIGEVFKAVGRMNWQSFVKHRLSLRNLPEEILVALQTGKIEYTKAQAIATVKDSLVRKQLLQDAIKSKLSLSEIKARIKELKPEKPSSLKDEFKQVLKIRSKVWEDPEKTRKIRLLLEQLQLLIGE